METGQSPEAENLAEHEDAGSAPHASAESSYDPQGYKDELLIERREKAWQLRVVERKTYTQIATELGVNASTVSSDIKWLLGQRVQALKERDKALVVKHDEIFEALLNKWLPVATSADEVVTDRDGNRVVDTRSLDAVDRVLKILAEQAKLHGLQATAKPASPAELGHAVGEHVLLAMQKLAQGFTQKRKVLEAELVRPELGNGKETS